MMVINKGWNDLNELDSLFIFWILDRWILFVFVLRNNEFKLLCLTNFFVDDFEYNLDCQFK